MPLFSDRSLLTMLHGVVLGGGSLAMLSAALFFLAAWRPAVAADPAGGRAFARLLVVNAVVLWLAVLAGTYVIFPPYRAAPPEGTVDLAAYPKALLQADPETAWLHSSAMEAKEHLPWIAAMLATAAAAVAARRPSPVLVDAFWRRWTGLLLAISFALVAAAGLLGTFVDKVAPLE